MATPAAMELKEMNDGSRTRATQNRWHGVSDIEICNESRLVGLIGDVSLMMKIWAYQVFKGDGFLSQYYRCSS